MTARPVTGQAFFVLTALADGPRHGYGIVGDVAELSLGRVRLKIGSLYGVLERLAAEGLIEPDREEAHHGRHRAVVVDPGPAGCRGQDVPDHHAHRLPARPPHLINVSLAELLIMLAAAALVAADAARAQAATPAPPPYPHVMAA